MPRFESEVLIVNMVLFLLIGVEIITFVLLLLEEDKKHECMDFRSPQAQDSPPFVCATLAS